MPTVRPENTGVSTILGLCALICLLGGDLHAQVDLKYATYGTDTPAEGAAPVSNVTSTVSSFVVTQIYTNSTATYTHNFISDGSGVSNYIYVPISATSPDPFAVGSRYANVSLTASPFGTPQNLEFTVPAGTTVPAASATGVVGMFTLMAESSLTTTSPLTDNYATPTSTVPNDIEPVEFTFTASENKTVTAVTGNYRGTDANNGDVINFYRPNNDLNFTAGTTYTLHGYAFAFGSGVEIYTPSIIASSVPEPSTWALVGIGVLTATILRAPVLKRVASGQPF